MSAARKDPGSAAMTWRDLLELSPKLLWVILAFLVFCLAQGPIRRSLDNGEVSKLSFAMLQIEFTRHDFSTAAAQISDFRNSPPVELNAYADRMQAAGPRLVGAKGLWVADESASRYLPERRALNALGVSFDLARNNDEARELLEATSSRTSNKKQLPYDFVITDMHRDNDHKTVECFPHFSSTYAEAGCETIELVQVFYPDRSVPIIIYSADAKRGTPPGALGGADTYDELMSLVLDAVERRRLRSG